MHRDTDTFAASCLPLDKSLFPSSTPSRNACGAENAQGTAGCCSQIDPQLSKVVVDKQKSITYVQNLGLAFLA